MRTSLWTAALAVGATILLAGCSGGGLDDRAAVDPGGVARASSAPAGQPAAPSGDTSGGGASGRTSTSAPLVVPARILTADIAVAVTRGQDVAARADTAGDLVVARGGRIDADRRTGGADASATLVLRVPPAELPALLHGLARLGHVTSRDASTRDATDRVADVTSRVVSAQRAIVRLRTLYDRAPKVTDVVAIEQELSSREADLESMQAQQRTLSAQISLATVTVSLRTAPRGTTPPATDDRSGFLGGLADGWDAFVRAAVATGTGLGAALPFLALLIVLGAGSRLVVVRRRRADPVPEPVGFGDDS